MPRYFFNVADGSASPDREGTELLDLAEARLEAVRLTGQMFLDDPEEFWRTGEWWVQVADGDHVTLFTLYTTSADGPGVRPSRRAAPDPAAEARAPNRRGEASSRGGGEPEQGLAARGRWAHRAENPAVASTRQ